MALFSALLSAALLLTACSLFGPAVQNPTPTVNIYTQAAQTLQAMSTATLTSTLSLPNTGSTPFPTSTATLEPTSLPSLTPTSAPPVLVTPIGEAPCDWLQFVGDVSVPDGSTFVAGSPFTKIWRLRNIGTCTWTTEFSLVFVSGARMGAPASIPLPANVIPGGTLDVALNLVAPNTLGRQRGYWMLRDANGNTFGGGSDANQAIWVDINVTLQPNPAYAYDFAANLCAATWRTNRGPISCPTAENPDNGSIAVLTRPPLETGRVEDELTIWSVPPVGRNAWVQGRYPVYRVNPGDHFLADIGCLAQSAGCDITFTVNYILNNEQSPQALGSWRETLDGKLRHVDIALEPFAGRDIQLFLAVINNNPNGQANAFWLAPSIRNLGVAPVTAAPPTATRAPTDTALPPTATQAPPTATQAPPTATPPPSATLPPATATLPPPTATLPPPTATLPPGPTATSPITGTLAP